MNTKDILSKGIEVVSFLLAAFSGFLKNIAPPEEANATFAVGLSSVLTLVVFLLASALSKSRFRKKYKKIWLSASAAFFLVAIIAAFVYKGNTDELTFAYPPGNTKAEFIGGTVFTPEGQAYRASHPQETISELVADYGGIAQRELIWTRDSIHWASMKLTINYVLLIVSLAGTIFGLTEGILIDPKQNAKTAKR